MGKIVGPCLVKSFDRSNAAPSRFISFRYSDVYYFLFLGDGNMMTMFLTGRASSILFSFLSIFLVTNLIPFFPSGPSCSKLR